MKYRVSHKTRDEVFEYNSLDEILDAGLDIVGELRHLLFSEMEKNGEESYDGEFNYYEIFSDD